MKTIKEFAWNVNYYYNNTTNSDNIGHFFAYDVMTFPEKCEMSEGRKKLLISLVSEMDDRKAMVLFLTEFVAS